MKFVKGNYRELKVIDIREISDGDSVLKVEILMNGEVMGVFDPSDSSLNIFDKVLEARGVKVKPNEDWFNHI